MSFCFKNSQSLVPGREDLIQLAPAQAVRIHTAHAGHITPCNYQPALIATAKRSLIILIFYHKSSHYYPSSLCLFSVPGHLQEEEKNPGTRLIFPQPCLPGSVRFPAAQCHATALAGTLGLKLAETWRATGNLLTRLASRAEHGSARDINKKPRRAFQQAH